ncbi:MAG: hypothetical protein FWC22_01815 [Treponema sp.]|nr:hypothetical protein [Treponema sp.]
MNEWNRNSPGNLPEIWQDKNFSQDRWNERRKQIINILCEEAYGFLPPAPKKTEWTICETDNEFCAGKAPLKKVLLNITLTNNNLFTLPVNAVIPANVKNAPFFVYISFSPNVPDKFLPCEEIIDSGFGILSFFYEDAASDNADFSSGLPAALGLNDNSSCGKIAVWAWAALRVMDYAYSLAELDKNRAAVAGHSRLGKTALLAGALDTRFKYIISNNSGCCGAALSRSKKGETIRNITDAFPYWFKSGFNKFADNEDKLPFDQHFLIAASAPRNVYVSSAEDDTWADPNSEFIGCKNAGGIWTKLGYQGLVVDDNKPVTGKLYHAGEVAYHVRSGGHYLGREDWRNFMKYINKPER